MPVRKPTKRTKKTRATKSGPTKRRAKPAPRARATGHPVMRTKSKAEAASVARLRAICLALPGAEEKLAWGEATWRAGKMFAQMDTHHHGADHVAVWLPAEPGVQDALVEENPAHFFVPPYVGHKGWIGVRIDRKPDWRVVAGLVADAYRMVASPALIEKLDADRKSPRGWRASWLAGGDAEMDE